MNDSDVAVLLNKKLGLTWGSWYRSSQNKTDFPPYGSCCNGLNISSECLCIWYNNLFEAIDISSIMTISNSEYLFLSSQQFLSLNDINFSWQEKF